MLYILSCKKIITVAFLAAGLSVLPSCKKSDVDPPISNLNPLPANAPSVENKVRDSVLQLARDMFLWYNQIPATFDSQTYSTPEETMTAIRSYSIESPFTTAVDKWSFAMLKTEWDNSSTGRVQQTAEGNADLGMSVFFRSEGDLRVRHVEPESAAGRAGVRRGWRITTINGRTNIRTSNAATILNAVYESTNSSFSFQKPDGTIVDVRLVANAYTEHPVVFDSVFIIGNRKAGYLVFNSFLGDTTQIYRDLNRVFSRFSRDGVNELIVDLRYNGGGYVNVQERLANYLINSAFNGQVMMSERFNDKNSRYNSTSRFRKLGSVNVSSIYFIVSSSTASASELLINNLKPYMDVILVGPSNTHGKPVGFFPISVGKWYIFPISFRTVNKNGEGNYFNGLQVNSRVSDGIDKDWGDRKETALSNILNGLANNTLSSNNNRDQNAEDPVIESVNIKLSERKFKGTIDTRGLR